MTRAQARRRRQRRRKTRQAAAWAIVLTAELLAAGAQTAVLAVILVKAARAARGYAAFGGEWLMIAIFFCGAFSIIHKQVCDKLFGEEGKRVKYSICPDCGAHLDHGERCDCTREQQEPDRKGGERY